MTWIKTVPGQKADAKLAGCMQDAMSLYPKEYAVPVAHLNNGRQEGDAAAIIMSHTLIPEALKHAFSTYGVLLQENLPLSRRDHELIAATVSALNDCYY